MKLRVVVEYDAEVRGYAAYCPELPGCTSAGDSEEEALKIRAETDLEAAVISAGAYEKAQGLRGAGDAEADHGHPRYLEEIDEGWVAEVAADEVADVDAPLGWGEPGAGVDEAVFQETGEPVGRLPDNVGDDAAEELE